MSDDSKQFFRKDEQMRGVIKKIVTGYGRLARALLPYLLIIAAIGVTSLAISSVLWFFSTRFTAIYTLSVLTAIGILLAVRFFFGIKNKKLPGRLFNFASLAAELVVIMYLFAGKQTFIPAIILSAEYIFFLGFSFRIHGFLDPWMRIILILAAFIGFGYALALLFIDRQYIAMILLTAFYLLSFGYLLFERNKRAADGPPEASLGE